MCPSPKIGSAWTVALGRLVWFCGVAALVGDACGSDRGAARGDAGDGAVPVGASGGRGGAGGAGGWGGCQPTLIPCCGDGVRDPGEDCDDRNLEAGDGCNGLCQVEANWACSGDCRRISICGDGQVTSDEVCDDGASTPSSGDGCSADCQRIEPGWSCPVPGKACHRIDNGRWPMDAGASEAVCGNGIIERGEECDDGDRFDDEGYGACTRLCRLGPHCGDGIKNGPEACDVGPDNVATYGDLDGCTAACTKPPFCGDGLADSTLGEMCDLGELNGQPDQRCDRDCRIVGEQQVTCFIPCL